MDQTTSRLALPGAVPARRDWRTPALGRVVEALTRAVDGCLHPIVVLPLFIAFLTPSIVAIGRAIAIILAAEMLGAAVGAAVAAALLERRPALRLGASLTATILRALALLALAGVGTGALAPPAGRPLLDTCLALLAGAAVFGGFAAPLRPESAGGVGGLVTRGGGRSGWPLVGALATVAGALIARPYLARIDDFLRDPYGTVWSQLFLIGGLLTILVAIAAALIRAPGTAGMVGARHGGLLAIPELLINNLAYGRFVFFRALYALGTIADPFYIIYATRELGGSGRTAAGYLLVLAIARAAGVVLWRTMGTGNNLILQLAAFVRLLAPITALTLPPLLGSATLRDRLPGGGGANLVAFGAVFVAYGIASVGFDLAAPTIQAGMTTPRERAAAVTVTSLALAAVAPIALLGGVVIDRLGFPFLFIVALMVGLGGLFAGGLIEEPGAVTLRAPVGERLPQRRRRRVPSEE